MSDRTSFTRRQLVVGGSIGLGGLMLAGCQTTGSSPGSGFASDALPSPELMYGPKPNEQFPLPAIDRSRVEPNYYRKRVHYRTREKPGTIVVDTSSFYLYLVEPNGKAMRYGVGLGRAGFAWSGRAHVGWKQKWPKWTPPDEMIERQPHLKRYSADNGGMPPGLKNPLGARALYIFQDKEDTLYRIHGTPEFWTIGKAVSSGCVRMMNQDVIDLYERVKSGSSIVVT